VPLDVDFGVVRPTQAASRVVVVKNVGQDPLTLRGAQLQGSRDFALDSSTQGGALAPGESAPVVVVYSPAGDGEDEATLTLQSDDRDAPSAVVNLRGTGGDNAPPIAVCSESAGGGSTATVRVGDRTGVDGMASSDPEGDPLVFQWSLASPAGAAASLEDPAAQRAIFTPDVAGSYTVTLIARDSLGQPSQPCAVTIDATARYGFRARARWDSGGDVDLHLVESGSALYSARDVRFDLRTVDGFELLDDAEHGPGSEDIAGVLPASGTWEVWVVLFDDAGLGAVSASLDVILNDALPPSFTANHTLPASCAAWHVGDVSFPSGAVTLVDATSTLCP
jgi:hypothetical protein